MRVPILPWIETITQTPRNETLISVGRLEIIRNRNKIGIEYFDPQHKSRQLIQGVVILAERVYEGMYLLDANKYSRDPGNVSTRVGEMIEKCGGEVLASRLWAEQKLAYTINGQRKGAYWLTYFRLENSKLGELRRAAQHNNDILRDLVLSVDDRLVEALVSHASSDGKSEPAPAKPSAAATPTAEATPTVEAADESATATATAVAEPEATAETKEKENGKEEENGK